MNGGDAFESRDSAIKLFGKTISAPESHAPATAAANPDVGSQIPGKPQSLDVCSEISKAETKDTHLEDCGNQAKSSVAEDGDEDKVLRKPDKIIPCPRCDSMETKFCYFNNYNVNQPRHFCKNCQRYWTAGGTMRNVPVGAGRRKNKQFPSQYGQILVPAPSTPQATTMEVPDSTNRENIEEPSSCVSSVTSSSTPSLTQSNPTQWYPVAPWALPSTHVPSVGNPNPVQWCTTQLLAVPGFSTQNIPLQFVPASYLGCLPVWPSGAIQKPMVVSDDRSLSSSTSNGCSGNDSPTLGKRARSDDLLGEQMQEKCVSVPKRPRVDDSEEASKGSVLGSLGFRPNRGETKFGCSMFRPFKSTGDCKDLATDKTDVLEANPAALSRSHTFQEST